MADPGGFDTGGNNTIQSLFAQLRATQQQQSATRGSSSALGQADPHAQGGFPPQPSTLPHGYHPAAASSPIVSPHPQYPPPRHHSAILSPNVPSPTVESHGFPSGQSNADRTASLLNLLKFNQPISGGPVSGSTAYSQPQADRRPPAQTSSARSQHGREISASDLVASFMSKPGPIASHGTEELPQHLSKSQVDSEPLERPENPQDFLLKLLNRPKPAQQEPVPSQRKEAPGKSYEHEPLDSAVGQLTEGIANATLKPALSQTTPELGKSPKQKNLPLRIFGEESNLDPSSTLESDAGSRKASSLFTYVNPFEQLAASSPRNRTPKLDQSRSGAATPSVEILKSSRDAASVINGDGNKRKNNETSAGAPELPAKKRAASTDETLAAATSPTPPLLPDGRSKLEALLGIGAGNKEAESVACALSEVEEQVDKQVEEALSKAEQDQEGHVELATAELNTNTSVPAEQKVEQELKDLAADVKQELDKEANEGALEESLPTPVADTVKEVIEDLTQGNVADSWESADGGDSSAKEEAKEIITVYNFPMRPFVSITIKPSHEQAFSLRQESVMDIARLKKEFDQVDRTLATSTNNFIVYAMSKSGGLRVIRQDDGKDKQIFRTTQDRIFSVTLSTAPPGSPAAGTEAVLATGVSGSVYWTTLINPSEDIFEDDDVGSKGIILPPMPAHDDNTSGGQLKTRAKKSSRHPEFFAIGRGRSIHIVWPLVAGSAKYLSKGKGRVVDSEKYFTERCLKITTGKAGKDFTFSEDDTLIVSLDKAGRLRFWDIRPLVDPSNGTQAMIAPIEVKTPLMTLFTIAPSEKSWPTSVLFVDKYRPYTKGIALRYVLVGMKQNHTFQLWDLALGKAVQELNFPHENESDAICSVSYHPNSGIIVVGHPTRNSIFFVHLSAPKYNLPAMSQAKYIQKLAANDNSIPKPDATAIMSGLREVSFESKGQLRSVDMLPTPAISLESSGREDPVLFELYAMHSKGVTCLNIKREDLGWSKENKVLRPVNAESEGVISVKDLRDLPPVANEASSTIPEDPAMPVLSRTAPVTSKGFPKEITRKENAMSPRPTLSMTPEATMIASTLTKVEGKQDATRSATTNGTKDSVGSIEKGDKKKKKRTEVVPRGADQPSSTVTSGENATSSTDLPSHSSVPPTTEARKAAAASTPETIASHIGGFHGKPIASGESINLGISGEWLDKELRKIENGVSAEFGRVLGRELDEIYRRFDADKRALDAASAAKHDAVLRLVSSTLSENVEKNLARMIGANIEQVVLPSVVETAAATLDRNLSNGLTHSLHQTIPLEISRALPDAISKAMQGPEVLRAISDMVASKVASHVEGDFSTVLHNNITPAFKSLAISTAQKMAGDVERRVGEQIRKSEVQRHNDSLKIDQLTNLVRGLSETVHTMATAQSDFQNEILRLQRHLAQSHNQMSQAASEEHHQISSSQTEEFEEKSEEQQELETIASLMREGNLEEGTIQWLQSTHQAELFDRFFVRFNPEYMRSLSPLVTLSVSAAVTSSLEENLLERFHWLETIFTTLNTRDPDIIEVAPKIMDVLSQRLEGLYMRVAETNPHDPALRLIPPLARRARDLKSTVA